MAIASVMGRRTSSRQVLTKPKQRRQDGGNTMKIVTKFFVILVLIAFGSPLAYAQVQKLPQTKLREPGEVKPRPVQPVRPGSAKKDPFQICLPIGGQKRCFSLGGGER